jgi:hypothetical protein
MMFLISIPLLAFFTCLLHAMWVANDPETKWQIPPYDWNFEDEELWITKDELLDYQRRED